MSLIKRPEEPKPKRGTTPSAPKQNPFGEGSTPSSQKSTSTFGLWNGIKSAGKQLAQNVGGAGMGVAKSFAQLPTQAAALGSEIGLRGADLVRDDATYEQLKSARQGSGMQQGIESSQQNFEANTGAEKVGKTAGEIAQFVIPVGAVGKASKITQGLKTLEKAPGIASKAAGFVGRGVTEGIEQSARAAVQKGTSEDAGKDFLIGGAFPLAGATVKKAGDIAGQIIKTTSSKLSGVPTAAIEEAFKNPQRVQKAIREMAENGEVGPDIILKNAQESLQELKDIRRAYYRADLDAAQKVSQGVKLDLTDAIDTAEKAMQKFNIVVKNGEVIFGPKTLLPKSYKTELQDVFDRFKEWDDFTPTGLDDLREVVDNYYKPVMNPSKADKQFNSIVYDIRQNLSDYIGKVSPEIKKMNTTYSQESELINALRRDLSLGEGKSPTTALRKLLNVFNSKSEVYRPLLKKMDEKTGEDTMADIAGLLMSKMSPEGTGGILSTLLGGVGGVASALNPAAIPVLAATAAQSSPRLVGEVVTRAGKAAQSKSLPKVIRTSKNTLKGAAGQQVE